MEKQNEDTFFSVVVTCVMHMHTKTHTHTQERGRHTHAHTQIHDTSNQRSHEDTHTHTHTWLVPSPLLLVTEFVWTLLSHSVFKTCFASKEEQRHNNTKGTHVSGTPRTEDVSSHTSPCSKQCHHTGEVEQHTHCAGAGPGMSSLLTPWALFTFCGHVHPCVAPISRLLAKQTGYIDNSTFGWVNNA